MENIKIFEKHFIKGMIVKDFEAFKITHPTLLKCILSAMNEVLPQADVIKSVCDCKPMEYDVSGIRYFKCRTCGEPMK